MRYHWQNLSAENRAGAWPRYGRCWFRFGRHTVGLEWHLWRLSSCHACVGTNEQGAEVVAGLGVPLLGALYLSVTTPIALRRLLPRHRWSTPSGETGSYPEDRELRLAIHSGSLWWTIWREPMGGWDRSVPRWRQGSFDPRRALLGREGCECTEGESVTVLVPMPEGNYPATVKREDRVWRRSRWPWPTRRRTDYRIDIPNGIPFEGKGENPWDCGPDALYGTGGSSVADLRAEPHGWRLPRPVRVKVEVQP